MSARHYYIGFILLLISIFSIFIGLILGSAGIGFPSESIVLSLRLPRALTAYTTGGLLALSGALLQIIIRNPLADPYILGISGGAATGNLLALLFGFSSLFLGGLIGSLFSIGLVMLLTRGQWSGDRLLLTGVLVAAFWGALMSFLLSISHPNTTHALLFWLMGDLTQSNTPIFSFVILSLGLCMSIVLAPSFDILILGELKAESLGVTTQRLRQQGYLLSSVLTTTAVTLAGPIGFIGLIVPHLLRLAEVHQHKYLFPFCVMTGGSLLTLADALARSLIAPQQLPVGVMMSFIGLPLFLFLLYRGKQSC